MSRRSGKALALTRRVVSRARVDFGKTGEELACGELERRGYVIVARPYACAVANSDISSRDGPTLVFVKWKALVSAGAI